MYPVEFHRMVGLLTGLFISLEMKNQCLFYSKKNNFPVSLKKSFLFPTFWSKEFFLNVFKLLL